jgi:hypothetical protein
VLVLVFSAAVLVLEIVFPSMPRVRAAAGRSPARLPLQRRPGLSSTSTRTRTSTNRSRSTFRRPSGPLGEMASVASRSDFKQRVTPSTINGAQGSAIRVFTTKAIPKHSAPRQAGESPAGRMIIARKQTPPCKKDSFHHWSYQPKAGCPSLGRRGEFTGGLRIAILVTFCQAYRCARKLDGFRIAGSQAEDQSCHLSESISLAWEMTASRGSPSVPASC